MQGADRGDETVAAARARFFRENGFPIDGGYEDDHAEADFGPVRYRVPNSQARADALRIHDLHHLATGYPTDWRGEAEISAWELGGGLGFRYPYAVITVLFGVFTGLVAHFGPTFRAFARGRREKNLYRQRFDAAWLRERLSTLRNELRVRDARPVPTISDALSFAAWSTVALLFGLFALPFVTLMVLGPAARSHITWTCPLRGTCPLTP